MPNASFRVALATCADYPTLNADDLLLLPELAARGIVAEPRLWDDRATEWQRFDAVVIRSPWDYYERMSEFSDWLSHLERERVRLFNPAAVIRRNLDKRYLQDLERDGVRIVPTAWLRRGDARGSEKLLYDAPWSEMVIKPTISAGAFLTVRTERIALLENPGPLLDILAHSDAMLQPFLPEIVRDGEWSFLYFGGEFSHAVLKRPKGGDFRVQWTHGGSQVLVPEPPQRARRGADRILEACGDGLLYARIDGIIRDDELLLIEAELLEPYLFFGEDPRAAGRYADALERALAR